MSRKDKGKGRSKEKYRNSGSLYTFSFQEFQIRLVYGYKLQNQLNNYSFGLLSVLD